MIKIIGGFPLQGCKLFEILIDIPAMQNYLHLFFLDGAFCVIFFFW